MNDVTVILLSKCAMRKSRLMLDLPYTDTSIHTYSNIMVKVQLHTCNKKKYVKVCCFTEKLTKDKKRDFNYIYTYCYSQISTVKSLQSGHAINRTPSPFEYFVFKSLFNKEPSMFKFPRIF